MYVYGRKSVERVWERNETKIRRTIVEKLIRSFNIQPYIWTEEEFFVAVQQLFFLLFYDKYENDKQFLSYLFVCSKNTLRNKINKHVTRSKYFVSDPNDIARNIGLGIENTESIYSKVWDNISDYKDEKYVVHLAMIINDIREKLCEIGRSFLDLMYVGKTQKEICEELGIDYVDYNDQLTEIKRIAKEIAGETINV